MKSREEIIIHLEGLKEIVLKLSSNGDISENEEDMAVRNKIIEENLLK